MPPTTEQPSRMPQKRRLPEAPESSAPESKRARKNGEATSETADPGQNAPPKPEATPSARDKKKRKKKKRKQPVVTQNADADAAGQGSAAESPARVRAKSPQNMSRSSGVEESSTPGPSKVKRSPSVSPEKPRSPSPPSRTQSEAPTVRPLPKYRCDDVISCPQVIPASEKGKARAISPVATNATSSADAMALASHKALLDTVLPSLTCQICLLLMSRPFALAPCGHVHCHHCLVNWFSTEPAAPLGQAVQQAEPPPAPAENNEGNDANGALVPAAAPAPEQRRPAPLIRRKKTCPHCRAVVREKPVEVWSIKDMVGAVARSGLADPESVPAGDAAPDAAADPWQDIFPDDSRGPFADLLRDSMGVRDDEDGGVYRCVDCQHEIWDGLCSGCARFYPGHRVELGGSDSADDEDGLQPMWLDYSDDDDADDDDAPHVDFLRRIMGGRYADVGDESRSEGSEDHHSANGDRGGIRINVSRRWLADEEGDEALEPFPGGAADNEGYESSFIDDDDNDGVIDIPDAHTVGGSYRVGNEAPIEISSDEGEDGQPRPARRGRRVVDSEEELSGEEEDDDGLAAEVAARERCVLPHQVRSVH